MKKYNRDKRARYNAHIKNMQTHDTCNAHDKRTRIHIDVHYDGYNHTQYVKIIYGKTRDTHAQTYVNTTNAIRDIFPELDKEHTSHVHRATAPYKRFIPTEYTGTHGYAEPPKRRKRHITYETTKHEFTKDVNNEIEHTIYKSKRMGDGIYTYVHKRVKRAKCIIFDKNDGIIYIGTLKREIKMNDDGTTTYTLYRNKRSIQVYPHITLQNNIHGLSIERIKEHAVEFYRI